LLSADGYGGGVVRRVPSGGGSVPEMPEAPPDRHPSPVPAIPQVSEEEQEGIRQFMGGRPGAARRDTGLGGLAHESDEEIRGMLAAGRQPVEGQRIEISSPTGRGQAAAPPRQGQRRLPGGALSAREETGGRGPGTVSTGVNDPGGVSYGSYQLASRRGQVQAFLRSGEASRWAPQLQGMAPGTRDFQRRWQQIAVREPEAFQGAQHDFIGRTHYLPAVTAVRRNTGVDLDSMPEAVRDAAWSASVQHGTAATVLTGAVQRADARVRQGNAAVDRSSPLYQEALINEMYDGRTALLTRLINSPRTSAGNRSTFRNVVNIRYPRERAAALRQLREEQARVAQAD
jgi:hypothetical protein